MDGWEQEHEELYGRKARRRKLTERQIERRVSAGTPPRFLQIRVSAVAEELFQDYEQSILRMAAIPKRGKKADKESAYADICRCRKAIYEHIQDMERLLDRQRPVIKRF